MIYEESSLIMRNLHYSGHTRGVSNPRGGNGRAVQISPRRPSHGIPTPKGRTTGRGTKHTKHLTRLVTQRGRRILDYVGAKRLGLGIRCDLFCTKHVAPSLPSSSCPCGPSRLMEP